MKGVRRVRQSVDISAPFGHPVRRSARIACACPVFSSCRFTLRRLGPPTTAGRWSIPADVLSAPSHQSSRSAATDLSVGRTPAGSRSVHPRLVRERCSRLGVFGPRRSLPHRNCGNGRRPVATMPCKPELPGHVPQAVAAEVCAGDASTLSITSFRLRFATVNHFTPQESAVVRW